LAQVRINKYYDDGRPHLVQTYIEDQLHGVKKSYDEDGKLAEVRFDHGQKVR